jgi:hypothetical protein
VSVCDLSIFRQESSENCSSARAACEEVLDPHCQQRAGRDTKRRSDYSLVYASPSPPPSLLPSLSFSSCSSSSRGSPSVPSLVPRARGHKRWQSYSWLLEQSSTHDPPQVMAPQSQHITMTVNPLDTSEHISLSLLCLSRR